MINLRMILLFSLHYLLVFSDQNTFDCKMRQLAMDYAFKIQPFRSLQHFQQLADALLGAPEVPKGCNVTLPNIKSGGKEKIHGFKVKWTGDNHFDGSKVKWTGDNGFDGSKVKWTGDNGFLNFGVSVTGTVVFVDTMLGKDLNLGTWSEPVRTIERALQITRAHGIQGSSIVIREGTIYLKETIVLTEEDNGLVIQNYPGEEVWISGGTLIHPLWKPHQVNNKPNILIYQDFNGLLPDQVKDHSDNGTLKFLGKFNTLHECEISCMTSTTPCHSFTYYTPLFKGSLACQCFGVTDYQWYLRRQDHVVTARVMESNIYVADLSGHHLSVVHGLRINGQRSIRARYPNADPELGFGSVLSAKSWIPPTPLQPDIEVYPQIPFRNTSDEFQRYQLGIGGSCHNFVPPAGFWCGNMTSGGSSFSYRVPKGLVADKTILPNSPYKNPVGSIIQAWRPGHWASWMFEVGNYDASSGTFQFSKGGYQGARGDDEGENFYIENVLEELDSPNEWFYDNKTQMLYLWYNGTGSPPLNTTFVVPQLKTLIFMNGTKQNPVKDIYIKGIYFRDTAYTYMDPHGMPSGGDWTLMRSGALLFEGTENVTVDSCLFTRLDGNGVMISGYNRYATIQKSEFSWIGDTAIASWGNTKGVNISGMGWDGSDEDQPRFNQILYNFVHELGIWEKQSSFYFQAKSCQNNIQGNIFFNGPRAAINFNDGFGGASNVTENLLLNTCRESGDHGPFNSWDRQVYQTNILPNTTTSTTKDFDHISYNFIIANYQSQEAIDNDDGSCYYNTHHNFLAYSEFGMKSDFGGHDNRHSYNIYAFVGSGFRLTGQRAGHEDYFFGNKLVMTRDGMYGVGMCVEPGMVRVHDNGVYSPNGSVMECGVTLDEWQAKGNDPGTTANKWPDDMVIVGWIKDLFSI